MKKQRTTRRIKIDLPSYFATPKWADLRANRPIVIICIKDGDVTDTIIKAVEPQASPSEPPYTPPNPPVEAPKVANLPEDGFEDELPPEEDPSPLKEELPEPSKAEVPKRPALPAKKEQDQGNTTLKVGARVEAVYRGSMVTGEVTSIEPDETEVVVRLDKNKERVFIKTKDLRNVLV